MINIIINCKVFVIYIYRYYIVGINLGFCHENMPEIFTSFLHEEVSSWIRNVTLPYHHHGKAKSYESSVCETVEEEDVFRAVSRYHTACLTYLELDESWRYRYLKGASKLS